MKNLAIGLVNIAEQQTVLELAAAERNLWRSIELFREIKDEFGEAVGHQELGRLLAYCGAFNEAAKELDEAIEFEVWRTNQQGVGVNWAYRALRALLMGDTKLALDAAQQARVLADVQRNERDIIRAEWLLGAALIDLRGFGNLEGLTQAATHLTEALQRCRRIGLVEFEPDILLAWARWHRAKGNSKEAQSHAEEALVIADRCEYRLKQAEIHNFLARFALDAGNREVARKEAEIAKERAWCDGPPHCYKPALDEAEKTLKEIG